MIAAEETLHGKLRPLLSLMRQSERTQNALRLGDLIDVINHDGLIVAALVISLPFASPLSLGPITTPASLFLLYAGWKTYRGARSEPASRKWKELSLPGPFVKTMRRCIVYSSNRLKWHRKRLSSKPGNQFQVRCGAGLILSAIILGIPVPLLPLTNTFPALGAASFSLALLLNSSRWFITGYLMNILGILVFASLGILIWWLGVDVLFSYFTSG